MHISIYYNALFKNFNGKIFTAWNNVQLVHWFTKHSMEWYYDSSEKSIYNSVHLIQKCK